MIHWHPDENTLLEFVSGRLDTARSLFVSSHLHYCASCRSAVKNLEILGASLLEDMESSQVSDNLLDDTLAAIDTAPIKEPEQCDRHRFPDNQTHFSYLPRAICHLVDGDLENANWKWRWPGLKIADVAKQEDCSLNLYWISAGRKMPAHDHHHEEVTLIIKGSFSDAYGTYRQGDVVTRHSKEKHAPVAGQNEDCFCLVLETGNPIFGGFTGKLLNTAQSVFRAS
ncbi:MAG: ChrR family anti-sigma-E factor [Pseudomonadota bacterium]